MKEHKSSISQLKEAIQISAKWGQMNLCLLLLIEASYWWVGFEHWAWSATWAQLGLAWRYAGVYEYPFSEKPIIIIIRTSKTRAQTPNPLESPRNGGLFLFPAPKPQTLASRTDSRIPNPAIRLHRRCTNLCAMPMRPPPKEPKAALPVPKQLMVHNPENEPLSRFFLEKWRAMMQEPDGFSENNYHSFAKANRSLCSSKEPIRTLKDFSNVR